jgi:hypothetical protein
MSNRDLRVAEKKVSAATTYLAAPSPGPPGLKNSVPMRWPGSLAGCRATAMLSRSPRGWDQSTGTRRVPHWVVAEPGQGAHCTLFALSARPMNF